MALHALNPPCLIHMLIDCMLYHVSGEKGGVRSNSIIIFHYTLLEHIYPYVSSQFKLPQNTNLVSAIYWFHQCEFSTLEL